MAIKVLPAAFTEDKERLARFEREAQLLAQLQHPNIESIFGLEESDGTKAVVIELVEGEGRRLRAREGDGSDGVGAADQLPQPSARVTVYNAYGQ